MKFLSFRAESRNTGRVIKSMMIVLIVRLSEVEASLLQGSDFAQPDRNKGIILFALLPKYYLKKLRFRVFLQFYTLLGITLKVEQVHRKIFTKAQF